MNKYELALHEIRSVLSEWDPRPMDDIIATKIVERLVAKGVIQSTDPEDLQDYRTGPLEPGRKIVGGGGDWQPAVPSRDAPLTEPGDHKDVL